MATKQLEVVVSATDRMTAPFRTMAGSVASFGGAAISAGQRAAGAFGGLIGHLTSLKGLLALAGVGFGLHQAVSSFNEATEALDKIGDASERLGLTVEQLSLLKYAADLNGSSWEEMAATMVTAMKNIGQFALTGEGKAAPFLRRLHVQLTDANGQLRDTFDLIPEIVAAIKTLPAVERVTVAQKIFGDNGIQILNMGVEALGAVREEAVRLGAIFSPAQVAAAQAYRDSIDRIGAAWLGLRAKLIESVAPALTELNNHLAEFIAAVPEMVGTLAGNIRKALSDDGPEGNAARARFARFFDAMKVMAVDAVRDTVQITGAVIFTFMDVLATVLPPMGTRIIAETLVYPLGWALNQMALSLGVISETLEQKARTMGTALMTMVKAYVAISTAGPNPVERLMDALENGVTAGALEKFSNDLSLNTGELLNSGKALVGWAEAMAKTSLAGIDAAAAMRGIAKANEQLKASDPNDFWGGMRAGIEKVTEEARNLYNQGLALSQGIVHSISGGISDALVEAISGAKSFGAAFKEMAQNVLKQIGQMILQMLVFRAVAGIAGSFLGGGAAVAAGPSSTFTDGAFVMPGGFNRGGMVEPLRFGWGGMVPGPNVNRDIVPALLTPGERVLNRSEARAYNAGGGGISITIVNNVGGGATVDPRTLAALEKASADGVMRALDTNPAMRERMRRRLA